MRRAARTAVEVCLGTQPGELVLIVDDGSARLIAQALQAAAGALGCPIRRVLMEPLPRSGMEPPTRVAAALLDARVAFLVTARSLTHTQARRAATQRGARIASLPGITKDLFTSGLDADFDEIEARVLAWTERLTMARSARITAPNGTDLRLDLSGRRGYAETGIFRAPGAVGNLPAGESSIAPAEDTAEGVLVVDGSLAGYGLLPEPLRLEIHAGTVCSADGPFGAQLMDLGRRLGNAALQVAELGIGAHPGLRLSGSALGDEKVLGTVHVAFGNNLSFGGRIDVASHIDAIAMASELRIDDVPLPLN